MGSVFSQGLSMMSKDIEVLPLGWSESGEPIRVPSGATGWRVKMYRPGAKKPDLVRTEFGIPTMVPLGATPLEFRALVGAGGRYRLEPVFPDGRSIADSEPAIIVLQEESEPSEAPAPSIGGTDALILKLIESHHESIARTHELMSESLAKTHGLINEMVTDHRSQVTALAEQNTKLVTSMAENFGSYLSGTTKLLKASSPPAPAPPRTALAALGEFREIRQLCTDLGDTDVEAGAPYAKVIAEGVESALPLLTQLIHRRVLGLTPEQTTALTGAEAPATKATTKGTAPPDFVAHLNAIEKHLTPQETATVRGAIGKMSPEQIRSWKTTLSKMPPDKAAARVREQLTTDGNS